MTPHRSAPEGAPTAGPITLDQAVLAEESTDALRRCTALAARARVELLGTGRRAAEELEQLLAEMLRWDDAALLDPDPTMLVLAIASLRDLAERLDDPGSDELRARIAAVVARLHAVMPAEGARPAPQPAPALGARA